MNINKYILTHISKFTYSHILMKLSDVRKTILCWHRFSDGNPWLRRKSEVDILHFWMPVSGEGTWPIRSGVVRVDTSKRFLGCAVDTRNILKCNILYTGEYEYSPYSTVC